MATNSYEHPEMTPTRVSRSVAWLLILTTTIVVLIPLGRHARDKSLTVPPLTSVLDLSTPARTWNHQLLEAIDIFELELREWAPLVEPLIPFAHWLLVRNGGMGNEATYVGPGAASGRGWLMLRSGYDHLLGSGFLNTDALEARRRDQPAWKGPLTPDPRPAIIQLHEQLAARGIELIVLPVPAKPAIHPEPFGALIDTEVVLENPSKELFLDTLRSHGMLVLDISAELRRMATSGPAAYMRTDSHWSPLAIDKVAQRLATLIEPMLPPKASQTSKAWTRLESQRQSRGDLWPSLNIPESHPLYDAETVTVHEVIAPDGRLWQPSSGAPVMVLGDSFSLVFSDDSLHWGRSAGLVEQLSYHLGLPVDRLAVAGSADLQVRLQLASSPQDLENTRVVVYQFAARELSSGDWPLIDFAPGR